MPYERKELQILGGGLNLLPSSDKVPQTDYLLAQNWRVDRAGKLVSRYGYRQKFSIPGAGIAHSAAVMGGVNGYYYVGCNNSLTNPAGSLYFALTGPPVATGFDGKRIGFAAMNDFMWVMNRGRQGRHNATAGFESWNIAPPLSSPFAASAGSPAPAASVNFTYPHSGDPTHTHFLTVSGVTYSFVENGYSAAQIPLVIASLASTDPNVTVTYPGTGQVVTIAPIMSGTLVTVSGSDGNPTTPLGFGAITDLFKGTYVFYVTFRNVDGSLESNPISSNSIELDNQAVTLTGVPVSTDPRVTQRNIYASGGTLGAAYLVGSINDNTSTSVTIASTDAQAVNAGVIMPVDNDPAPACSGIIGPHYSRLIAWSTAEHPNRLFYSKIGQPQYFSGSTDPQEGDWVDVGEDGEEILWCSIHANTLIIYKERSIWMQVGTFDTGTLEIVRDDIGLSGQFALASAGQVDYFVAAGGLYRFTLNQMDDAGMQIQPLFNTLITNAGPLTSPGTILPGTQFNSQSIATYAVSLGYAMGKLYMGYAEQSASGPQYCLMVFHEESGRWFYHRNAITGVTGFFGWVWDGNMMVGLTGTQGGAALGENVDDFGIWSPTDPVGKPIECVYQSRYEDAGLPDNPKIWLDVLVDYQSSDTATLYAAIAGGSPTALGTLPSSAGARATAGFGIAVNSVNGAIEPRNPAATTQLDCQAKNISVLVDCPASHPFIIHNIYLYFYEIPRTALSAATVPTDLGLGKVKQCKELLFDINSTGQVDVAVWTDLPGNSLTSRQSLTIPAMNRGLYKIPFPTTEGFIWKVALYASAGIFNLYSARMLMRAIGTYIEAYESAAGFVWDSQELTFDYPVDSVQQARELRFELDTFNQNVTMNLLTDLPGNSQQIRFTATINTGTAGRRFYSVPLPGGTTAQIEGRIFRVQFAGSVKYILYSAAIDLLSTGVFIEDYAAAGGAVWDSRELDFGTTKVKEAREIQLDINTSGPVTVTLYADLPAPYQMHEVFATSIVTTGRQMINIPLTRSSAPFDYPLGRLFRVILSGSSSFTLYAATMRVRVLGEYLTGDEASGGAVWDTTPLDLGTERYKEFKKLEFEVETEAAATIQVFTDQGGTMALEFSGTIDTGGNHETVKIQLTHGVRGRLLQVIISGAGVKLYTGRIWWRPMNEAMAVWSWFALPVDATVPDWTDQALPVAPTDAQWTWKPVITVAETPGEWTLVDLDMSVA